MFGGYKGEERINFWVLVTPLHVETHELFQLN